MLEDGDIIVIPAKTSIVRVGGAVLMAQAVLLEEGETAGSYISKAGGYSERADRRKVIIMHADASVEVADTRSVVRPGDEIIVPPKVDTKVMQGLLDVSTIIYQVAVAAGVALTVALPR
jgi:protein involved in polysaccharide export with SLBB domain